MYNFERRSSHRRRISRALTDCSNELSAESPQALGGSLPGHLLAYTSADMADAELRAILERTSWLDKGLVDMVLADNLIPWSLVSPRSSLLSSAIGYVCLLFFDPCSKR